MKLGYSVIALLSFLSLSSTPLVSGLFPRHKLLKNPYSVEKGNQIKAKHEEKRRLSSAAGDAAPTGPQELYYTNMFVDHFNNAGNNTAVYSLRYILDTTYFDPVDGC